MANELYQYPTPLESSVQVTLDNGMMILGVRGFYKQRDGYCCYIPSAVTTTMGCVLSISAPGKLAFANRGLLIPSATGEALFCLDDVTLQDGAAAPPVEPDTPVYSGSPADIINQVYNAGTFNLATKAGCGLFTEACCDALHWNDSQMWGHIRKFEGQNQYNSHAVDAVMLMTQSGGTPPGGYDIIHNSVSPDASPAFNYAGVADGTLWYYPADAPPDAREVVGRTAVKSSAAKKK